MNDAIDQNDYEYAKSRYGNFIGWFPGVLGKGGKINPHVTRLLKTDRTSVSIFHVKPVYYETATGHWRPLSEVTLYHGNRNVILSDKWWNIHPRYISWLEKRCKLLGGELLIQSSFNSYPTPYSGIARSVHESLVPIKLGLTTTTVYPDPHPETTTCDGAAGRSASSASWNTLVTSAGDFSVDNGILDGRLFAFWAHAGVYEDIYRTFVLFDTSSITDSDTIDSAVLTVTNAEASDPGSQSPDTDVYTGTPASNTAIASSDYGNTGSTSQTGAATAYGSIPNGGSLDFTFNSTGRGNVSKTGVSKFVVKNANYDNANNAPSISAGDTYSRMYMSEQTGTGSDPKLVVVHTASATFIPRVSFIM